MTVPHKNSLLAPSTLLPVADPSEVGEVRRYCQSAAEQLGFDSTRAGNVAIVATELANNIVRHAANGGVVVRTSKDESAGMLDLLAIDRGPGMRDVSRCMEDGYSTFSGGSGTGLGAIRRLADEFDIYSGPKLGTAVLARFSLAKRPASRMDVGALSLPYPGEVVCGDAWQIAQDVESCSIAVIDGLGHGIEAGAAAQEAVRSIQGDSRRSIEQQLEFAHRALKHTRGAAMALAEIDLRSGHIAFAGVGNIVGVTTSADTQHRMVSFDGTIGHEVYKIKVFEYSLERNHVFVMHTDGLRSQWKIEEYPGLLTRDPFLIAGVLYRDYFKGYDDVTVVVARAVSP